MEVPAEKVKVKGISPKVLNPAVLLVGAAIVLLILGQDDVAGALLAAALGQFGVGYASKAGDVEVPAPDPAP